MSYPGPILTATYDIRLLIVSILIAVIGSYTALDISSGVMLAQGTARRWWFLSSALTLGISIWAMHFTAIVAHQLPLPVGYDLRIILVSMLVAIMGSGAGLFVAIREQELGWLPLSVCGVFISSGIIGMHYTAMSALQVAAQQSYEPKLVVLSGAVALGGSAAALWLAFQSRTPPIRLEDVRTIGSALLMATAISGMHYIAMAGVSFRSAPLKRSLFAVIDNWLLSVVIGLATLLILTLALLASVFGRRLSAQLAASAALQQSEKYLQQLVEQRTAELEAQKLLADAANQAKTDFLANMSHELRTPLTSVIGFSSILLEQTFGPLNAQQHQYLANIHQCGEQLLDLINDLLDLSKAEAGQEELEFLTLSIVEVCQKCLSLMLSQASSRGLQLLLIIEPNLVTCRADPRRLPQILLNLLSNALKFTETGSVTLKVESGSNCIHFQVIDTGIGIPSAQQGTVFEAFRQLDSGLNRKYQGTGLGLALARNLARLHGGDITLKSEVGCGSCFTLVLPQPPLA